MDLRKYCRLRALAAKERGKSERINATNTLPIGYAKDDGSFETSRVDNFRHIRGNLFCGQFAMPQKERSELVKFLRFMRLDEIRHRKARPQYV